MCCPIGSEKCFQLISLLFYSYVLFSIGNIKPLFKQVFSNCWSTHKVCNKQWINAVDYLEVVGIIVGQILVGFVGDWYLSSPVLLAL